MAMVVKNNMDATNTLNGLNKNTEALAKSLAKVSSGMKIRGAGDDASGFAISEKMRVQVRGLQQDIQNGQTATSILKVAEGAVSSTVEILKTLKEKAINSANDTNTDLDRQTIQKEFEQSIDQIDDNALVTYNGKYMLDGMSTIDVPATALDAVMTFMGTLDKTAQSGMQAVDEAVNAASGGLFENMQNLTDSFLDDLERHSGSEQSKQMEFLKEYCGIDLTNTDTGAITGWDAGGNTVKTADSVVPEESSPPISGWDMPAGNSTTINGLTINWPASYAAMADINGSGVTASVDDQQRIIKALNTEWMKSCLGLVADSFGLQFGEHGTYTNTINVSFANDSEDNGLAWVMPGVPLELTFNLYYYSSIDDNDVNGVDTLSGQTYLDRVLAHELTHAVMSANIHDFSDLPLYIIEGSAELVHGIDDQRTSSILELSSPENLTNFRRMLEGKVEDIDDTGIHASVYAGGYMILRYMAKQSAYYGGAEDFAYRLSDKPFVFQLGTRANQCIKMGFGDMRAASLKLVSPEGEKLSVVTREKATKALTTLDYALAKALDQQTTIGAIQSRMEHTINNLTIACENVQKSESTIRDADMAKEMTEYTKNSVLSQTAQSMLAQANQNGSSVLSLLQ